MDSSWSYEPDHAAAPYEPSVLVQLLKQGLEAIVQERYAEGAALFAVVRANLAPEHLPFLALLDAFLAIHTTYQQAEQVLQEASVRFVEACAEQRTRVAALAPPLATLVSNMEARYTHDAERAVRQHSLPDTEPRIVALPRSGASEETWYAVGLSISCFGQFQVRYHGRPLLLSPNRKAQAVLRYLAATPGHHASSDTLQAVFWSEDTAEAAQHKLHIAMSNLRRSLQQGTGGQDVILYKNHVYALNPLLHIRVDVDIFLDCYQRGQQQSKDRIANYQRACRLYTGPFLIEDVYMDWSSLQREKVRHHYLTMCSVLARHYLQAQQYEEAQMWATAMLTENKCDEMAHQLLIQIYVAQGRRHDALQQYHTCERILREELGVRPLPETGATLHSLFPGQLTSVKKKQSGKRSRGEE